MSGSRCGRYAASQRRSRAVCSRRPGGAPSAVPGPDDDAVAHPGVVGEEPLRDPGVRRDPPGGEPLGQVVAQRPVLPAEAEAGHDHHREAAVRAQQAGGAFHAHRVDVRGVGGPVAGGRVPDLVRRLVRRVAEDDVEPAGRGGRRELRQPGGAAEEVAGADGPPQVRQRPAAPPAGRGGEPQEEPQPRDLGGLGQEVDAEEVRARGVREQVALRDLRRADAGQQPADAGMVAVRGLPAGGVDDGAVERVQVIQGGEQERAGSARRVEDPQLRQAVPGGDDVVRAVEGVDDVDRERLEVEVRGDGVVRRPDPALGQRRPQVLGAPAAVQGLPPRLAGQPDAVRRARVQHAGPVRGGRVGGRGRGDVRRQRLAGAVRERLPEVAAGVVAQRPPGVDPGPRGQPLEEERRHGVRDQVPGDVGLRVVGAVPAVHDLLEDVAEHAGVDLVRVPGRVVAEAPAELVEEREQLGESGVRHADLAGLHDRVVGDARPPQERPGHQPAHQQGGVPVAVRRAGQSLDGAREPLVPLGEPPVEALGRRLAVHGAAQAAPQLLGRRLPARDDLEAREPRDQRPAGDVEGVPVGADPGGTLAGGVRRLRPQPELVRGVVEDQQPLGPRRAERAGDGPPRRRGRHGGARPDLAAAVRRDAREPVRRRRPSGPRGGARPARSSRGRRRRGR